MRCGLALRGLETEAGQEPRDAGASGSCGGRREVGGGFWSLQKGPAPPDLNVSRVTQPTGAPPPDQATAGSSEEAGLTPARGLLLAQDPLPKYQAPLCSPQTLAWTPGFCQ